jgi:hypothetical protein
MNKTNLEIKCLARLDELAATNESITEFLIAEDLMSKEERKAIKASSDTAKALQGHIAKMKGNKLQLVEYSWELLPEERLKVILVTDRNSKEFSYNY